MDVKLGNFQNSTLKKKYLPLENSCGVNVWNKWNWFISVKSNVERGCVIGNHLFSQKRNTFLCNKIQFFSVSFPKHLYCASRRLFLDTPRFD